MATTSWVYRSGARPPEMPTFSGFSQKFLWKTLPFASEYHLSTVIHNFSAEQWVPFPLPDVFRFFADPRNLPRIMPAWMDIKLERLDVVPPPGLTAVFAGIGSELEASYRAIPFLPLRVRSVAIITDFRLNQYFEDAQGKGPFQSWHHRHEFAEEMRNGIVGTIVRDRIAYDAGFGVVGSWGQRFTIAPQLQRTFDHRQRVLPGLLGL